MQASFGGRFTDRELSVVIVAGAVVLGLFALFGPIWPARDLSATFTPEMLDWLQMIDSTPQRRAHQLALAFLFFGSLATLWLFHRRPQRLGKIGATAGGPLRLALRPGPVLSVLTGATILLLAPQPRLLIYGLLLVPVALLVRYMRPGPLNKAAWAVLLAYMVWMMLPGFFLAPWLQTDPMWLEWHYGSTVGVGEQLAAGLQLYGEIHHHYGLLLSMASGMFERHVAALGAGQYYRVLQALNLAFALLAGLAYWRWRRGNALKVLAPLMLVLPFIHSQHLCLNFPNHSAWRFIGLPVVALLLLALRRREAERLPLALGAVAALALLFNLETGIAFCFGILVFLVARIGPAPLPSWLPRAAWFTAGLLAVMLLTALLYRAGLGTWPVRSWSDVVDSVSSYAEGYAGYPLSGDPLALAIFLHAAYVVTHGALRWRFGALSFATAFRMSIATTLLVWFAYYVNRPLPWYLWSFLFLYGFLLADFVDCRLLRWNWADVRRLKLPLGTLVLALVLVPVGMAENRTATARLRWDVKVALKTMAKCVLSRSAPGLGGCVPSEFGLPPAGPPVSGMPVPANLGALITEKAEYLRVQPDRHELVYFTVNSYFIPRLTGLYERRLGFRDAFTETITNRQMDELVSHLLALKPPRILFDAPDSLVFGEFVTQPPKRFLEHLRARLQSAYRPAGTEHGWLILVPMVQPK
jgi:hypothetical protein